MQHSSVVARTGRLFGVLPTPDRNQLHRLLLQIARASQRRQSLRVLLAAADSDIAGRQRELRSLEARIPLLMKAPAPTRPKAPSHKRTI